MSAIITIVIILVALVTLLFSFTLVKLATGNARVQKELARLPSEKMPYIGEVDRLEVLPLVDYYASDEGLRTEPGVSYLVRAGDKNILLDLGLNAKKEHPSPLLHNMQALDVDPQSLDMIFISHPHLDHLGGMAEQKSGTFSVSQGPVDLPGIPVYAPAPLEAGPHNPRPNVEVITRPTKLAEGVASMGVIPRNLYLAGYTPEQALVVNVRGKGLVIIIGCGHQTIERILEQAERLFDEPVHAVIGGLHFPVHGGRIKVGPLDMQAIVGADRPPWNSVNEKDVASGLAALTRADPRLVALSPHDSSDWAIDRFKEVFPDRYRDIRVGDPIVVEAEA
ncbi:MAG: MBL fold metallo-hydrolase [Desulfatibacillaceae bacterium]